MSLAKGLYQSFFKRTSVMTVVVFSGALVFGSIFDPVMDKVFYNMNKGVRALCCGGFFHLRQTAAAAEMAKLSR